MAGDSRPKNVQIISEVLAGNRPEESLSASLKQYAENMRLCLGLLLKGYTQATISSMLQTELMVSDRTAWRLIKDTEDIYGSQGEVDKSMKRIIASEMAQQAYELALGKGNERNMVAATNAYIKVWALDREDPDLPDFKKLDTPANILVIPDEVAAKLQALPAGGSLNLNQLMDTLLDEIAEDVEYDNTEGAAESGDSETAS